MTERPTSDEARDWLKKHLALAPERDQAWIDRMLSAYASSGQGALRGPKSPR